jgi:SAM-dependent methyltransferase
MAHTSAAAPRVAPSPRVVCPVCRSASTRRAFAAGDPHYGIAGTWQIRRCDACGTLFVEDVPGEAELAAMYPEESYYSFRIPPVPGWKRLLRRVLAYDSPPREPRFAAPGRVLDFGCGAGERLLAMRAEGWECAGVELSAAARRAAAEQGLDVRPSVLGPDGFAPESFDYVRANHALEHVLDPEATLRDLLAALRPGGTLFLGVPTATGQNARLFGPSWWYLTPPLHPVVFSTRGLVALVERVGFRDARTWTNSDFASTAGSLQIRLNRGTRWRSNEGVLFRAKPLLLVGHWLAKLQDLAGVGDKLELVARKPPRA